MRNGQPLLFAPCTGSDVQKWSLDEEGGAKGGGLSVPGTDGAEGSDGYHHGGECADVAKDAAIPNKLQVRPARAPCASLRARQQPRPFGAALSGAHRGARPLRLHLLSQPSLLDFASGMDLLRWLCQPAVA